MIFKDEVLIHASSGKGGDGAVSFRREKFVPDGGPDGGDGGNGGSIIVQVNPQLHTLAKFHSGQKFKAPAGEDGKEQKCFGRKGNDVILEVPPGTIVSEILEDQSQKIIADMSEGVMQITLLQGGRGGKGNVHYKSAVKQTPQYAQKGTLGQNKTLLLELKLIAHIGLAGFPNAGKSSLVSCLTNARPKVADYPFTTLVPNLGMMIPDTYGDGLLVADIPGLIEGASQGRGLGIEFLKHIERTKLLLFVLDITDSAPEKFAILRKELESYSSKLAKRNFVVCLNKIDLMPELSDEIIEFQQELQNQNVPVFFTSAGNGQGVAQLKKDLFQIWNSIPQDPSEIPILTEPKNTFDDFTIGLDL